MNPKDFFAELNCAMFTRWQSLTASSRGCLSDNPFRIAIVYAFPNEDDKVFEWLERAYNAHDSRVIDTAWEELLKPCRSDPRFAAFCQKVGLPVPQ